MQECGENTTINATINHLEVLITVNLILLGIDVADMGLWKAQKVDLPHNSPFDDRAVMIEGPAAGYLVRQRAYPQDGEENELA